MIRTLRFNDQDLSVYNLRVTGKHVFKAPVKSITKMTVPGRSGDLILPNKRFENVQITYESFIYRDFRKCFSGLINTLLAVDGYAKIEDDYNPLEYRMGVYLGGEEATPHKHMRLGEFILTFDCKPFRYLRSGDETTSFTASGSIENPTLFASRPLLRVYGAGTVGIGADTITISEAPTTGYTDIDCEAMEAYCSSELRNDYVTVSGLDFPELASGTNGITLGDGITQVDITPRWYRL